MRPTPPSDFVRWRCAVRWPDRLKALPTMLAVMQHGLVQPACLAAPARWAGLNPY